MKIFFDAEADDLETGFSNVVGRVKETRCNAVMERVDGDGRVVGFSVLT